MGSPSHPQVRGRRPEKHTKCTITVAATNMLRLRLLLVGLLRAERVPKTRVATFGS